MPVACPRAMRRLDEAEVARLRSRLLKGVPMRRLVAEAQVPEFVLLAYLGMLRNKVLLPATRAA